ncbi:TetR/AcrR family transcriptional regulator [Solimonas sp. K1W22B-7]|uniref:TetR/AcrR family transcriptional regulator n=1 Tax=Solimonas sp. K1W22B-7 TaxID=2303331 RepID=UPI000E335E03|nr:TetR/AcrR family transcriptional regulator [Solimonas sp. K1W22B-7]AXQ30249.1 TetR/AcrR family transcriptional regulator [Solimonas sp. K1W22B-7]
MLNKTPKGGSAGVAGRRPGRPARDAGGPGREALLEAALRQFAESGYEGASLRRLASELGVSDTLLVHYFGSKEAMWQEAVTLAAEPMEAQLRAVLEHPPGGDPLAGLRGSIRLVLQLAATRPPILRLAFREEGGDSERARQLRERFMEPYLDYVDTVLAQCRRRGLIVATPDASLHAMIVGAVRLLVEPGVLRRRGEALRADPTAQERYIEGVMQLLFEGLRQR